MDIDRKFLKISYDGRNFCGWQFQPNEISIQQTIQDALSILCRSDQKIVGCGRTDSGVHASCYYAHWDVPEGIEVNDKFKIKLNGLLPNTIAIHKIFDVSPKFHARYSAKQRHYKYYIHLEKNPFHRHYSYEFQYFKLDIEKMKHAASLLMNYTDFKPLVKRSKEHENYSCILSKSQITNVDDTLLLYEVSANRFLHNMVRRIVGTLVLIGRNKLSIDTFEDCMKKQEELPQIMLAPANGLQLADIEYEWEENEKEQ